MLVIGGGFTGSEIASVCRQLSSRSHWSARHTPLGGALGDVIDEIAADLQRGHGVDLRTGVEVGALEGDGRIHQVTLSDGTRLDVDVVVVAWLVRNVEWLQGSRLAAGPLGVSAGAGCRGLTSTASSPRRLRGRRRRAVPHPLTATSSQPRALGERRRPGQVVAHNMVCIRSAACPTSPCRRSGRSSSALNQIRRRPAVRRRIQFTQGSRADHVRSPRSGAMGGGDRMFFDQASGDFYRAQIESAAPFPLDLPRNDDATPGRAEPVTFPVATHHAPTVVLSGHDPDQVRAHVVGMDGGRS